MKICLETSSIIGFLRNEPDCEALGELLTMGEAGDVELFVSDFAWDEIYKPLYAADDDRKERLRRVAHPLPKVARLGEWQLGLDVLGHDASVEIERTLSGASRSDREQFLSYAALGVEVFVTKDSDYLEESVRPKLEKDYGFHVGTPDDCLAWVRHPETRWRAT